MKIVAIETHVCYARMRNWIFVKVVTEPCWPKNLEGQATIAAAVSRPIATGERLTSLDQFHRLLVMRGCWVLQPDITHCGGLSVARRIAALTEATRVSLALSRRRRGRLVTAVSAIARRAQLAACVLILVSGPAAADQVHEDGVIPAPRARVIEGRVDSRTGIRNLAFGRSGRVLEVDVEEGARFRRGQVLARLDCPEVKEDVHLAEAELESYRASYVRLHATPTTLDLEIARERLELAEVELSAANVSHERLQSLYAQNGLIPKQDLEAAAQRVIAAKLDVALHRQAHERIRVLVEADPELERAAGEQVRLAAVRRARQVLSMCEIRGPRDGIAVDVFLQPGEGASATSSVLSMVEDPQRRGISAWVPITSARDVRVGQRLQVRVPMIGDEPMSATVAWIAPVVSPANSSRIPSGAAAYGLTVWLTVQRALDEAPLHAPAYLYLDP